MSGFVPNGYFVDKAGTTVEIYDASARALAAANALEIAEGREKIAELTEENAALTSNMDGILSADYELVAGKNYVPVGELVSGKRFAFPSAGTVGQLIYINDYANKNLITAAVNAGEAYRIKASSGNDDRYNSAYAIADADGICIAFHREEGGGYNVYDNVVMPEGAVTLYAQAAINQDNPSIEKIVADPENSEYVNKTRKDIEAKLAKEHKARFDDSYLYISYSSVSGAGASINTAEMYGYCAKQGFNALKGDVRPTSDGGVIMCHDAGFTFDENGDITKYDADNCTLISSLTEAECLALKHAGTGNYVCNLETYIRICKKYGKIAYITIRDEQIAEVVVPVMYALLDKYRMRTRCIINSFTVASLEAVRAIDSDIMLSRVSTYSEGSSGITTAFVDSAINLGNCRIAIFCFGSSSTDVTVIDNSADAIAYALANDVRVDSGQVGEGISNDDLMARGICGAQMVVVPNLD